MIRMGIGPLGGENLIFKRKFRWTFKVNNICGSTEVPEHFVKVAARPNLTIEETEINFLNAKTWIPGKASWETITVTYYDVASRDNAGLWNWLASVYNFTKPKRLEQGANRAQYAGRAVLTMFDGCGKPLERWKMNDAWPQAINFGELDYSSSEEATVELTLRYSEVEYIPICPAFPVGPCCDGCQDNSSGSGGQVNASGSNAP